MRFIFLAVVFFISMPISALQFLGGSDGPTPFTKIHPPTLSNIVTELPVSSFAILEKSDELAYVGPDKVLRIHNLKNGKEITLGSFFSKLFPVTDLKEKYLLSSNRRVLKNIESDDNSREVQLPVASQFLFWEKEDLYLLRKLELVSAVKWQIEYYLFKAEKNLVQHKTCEFSLPQERKKIVLGEGHRFPNLLLYSPPSRGEDSLVVYYLDLRTRRDSCSLKTVSESSDLISGEIQSITQLNSQNDFVVLTNHDQWHLYFGKPGKWNYSNLPGGISYLPNPKAPLLVNLNRQRGLSIYSLKTHKYFNLDVSIEEDLASRDQIWIRSNSETLYLNTKDNSGSGEERSIFQLDLKKLNIDG